MSNLFISYSRKDKPFVEKLFNRLTADKREPVVSPELATPSGDVTTTQITPELEGNNESQSGYRGESVDISVDWNENILPGSEWLLEIYTAIENHDAFVYVISPDSAISLVCQKEIHHAIECNKRIIPILYRDVDSQSIVEPIQQLQWIDFLDGANFETAFQQLRLALDTDIAYWHKATDLLVSARKWEINHHNPSLTLRGSALLEAEKWLTESVSKVPIPTALQIQYITLSRRASNARQRTTVSVLSIFSSVMLILAITSFTFYHIAQDRERQAILEKDIALSQAVAGKADYYLLNHQLDLALLTSIRASQMNENFDTRDSLIRSVEFSPHIMKLLHGQEDPNNFGVASVLFSKNGQELFSAGADGSILSRDLLTGEVRPFSSSQTLMKNGIYSMALNPDNTLLAAAGVDGVWLWNTKTLMPVTQMPVPDSTLFNNPVVKFSPDGRVLAVGSLASDGSGFDQGQIVIWNVATKTLSSTLKMNQSNEPRDMAFSLNGDVLSICDGSQQIQLWDVTSKTQIGTLVDPNPNAAIISLAMNPSGGNLLSGDINGKISIWDLSLQKSIGQLISDGNYATLSIAISPNGQLAITANGDNAVRLWDLATGKIVGTPLYAQSSVVVTVNFSPDNQTFASGSEDGTIALWSTVSSHPIVRSLPVPKNSTNTYENDLSYSSDGKLAALESSNQTLRIWNVSTNESFNLPFTVANPDHVDNLFSFSPDDTLLTVLSYSQNTIAVWNLVTRKLMVEIPYSASVPIPGSKTIAISPNNKLIAAFLFSNTGTSDLTVWDIHSGKSISQIPIKASLQQLVSYSLTFGPDDHTIALGELGLVSIWNSVSGKLVSQIPSGHLEALSVIAFSPNGQVVAIGSGDSIQLWDIKKHEFIFSPFHDTNQVMISARFSDDNSRLLLIEKDASTDTYFLWERNIDIKLLQNQACNIVNRNFTQAEWKQIFGDEPYQVVCQNVPLT
jgi:WD40 repeat protein